MLVPSPSTMTTTRIFGYVKNVKVTFVNVFGKKWNVTFTAFSVNSCATNDSNWNRTVKVVIAQTIPIIKGSWLSLVLCCQQFVHLNLNCLMYEWKACVVLCLIFQSNRPKVKNDLFISSCFYFRFRMNNENRCNFEYDDWLTNRSTQSIEAARFFFSRCCCCCLNNYLHAQHAREPGPALRQRKSKCNKTDGVFNLHTNLSSDIFDLWLNLAPIQTTHFARI